MNYLLIVLARKKLQSLGRNVTPERFIYDAHEWNEKMVSLFTIRNEFEDATINDNLSGVVEDYCLAILSERSVPLWVNSENQLSGCGLSSLQNSVKH